MNRREYPKWERWLLGFLAATIVIGQYLSKYVIFGWTITKAILINILDIVIFLVETSYSAVKSMSSTCRNAFTGQGRKKILSFGLLLFLLYLPLYIWTGRWVLLAEFTQSYFETFWVTFDYDIYLVLLAVWNFLKFTNVFMGWAVLASWLPMVNIFQMPWYLLWAVIEPFYLFIVAVVPSAFRFWIGYDMTYTLVSKFLGEISRKLGWYLMGWSDSCRYPFVGYDKDPRLSGDDFQLGSIFDPFEAGLLDMTELNWNYMPGSEFVPVNEAYNARTITKLPEWIQQVHFAGNPDPFNLNWVIDFDSHWFWKLSSEVPFFRALSYLWLQNVLSIEVILTLLCILPMAWVCYCTYIRKDDDWFKDPSLYGNQYDYDSEDPSLYQDDNK